MTDFRISVASPSIPIYSDIDKIQKGGIGKTMAARDLVNGTAPKEWEGFSFSNAPLLYRNKKQRS